MRRQIEKDVMRREVEREVEHIPPKTEYRDHSGDEDTEEDSSENEETDYLTPEQLMQ